MSSGIPAIDIAPFLDGSGKQAVAMKVAHAAEGFGLDVEFHGGGLAHRHCIAAIRNTNYYENGLLHPLVERTKPPILPPEFSDELENVDGDGCVPVPDGPGLGVELDWDYIEANKTGEQVFEEVRARKSEGLRDDRQGVSHEQGASRHLTASEAQAFASSFAMTTRDPTFNEDGKQARV